MKLLHANGARGEHAASWYAATATPERYPVVANDIDVDVVVIGGGFTGLSAARELAERGHSVALLEAHRIGWGASGRNGGQLGTGYNADMADIERQLGLDDARALWRLAEDGKAIAAALAAAHADDAERDIQYRPGIIAALHRTRFVERARREAEHLAATYDYDGFEWLDRAACRAAVNSDDYVGGIRDRYAGHLHPLRLALAQAAVAAGAGARLYEGSEVRHIDSDGSGSQRFTVQAERSRLRCEHVVLAGNGYLDALDQRFARQVMPINNFIVTTEPLGARAEALIPGNEAVADSRFVVNYYRRTPDGRLLFGGGETYGYRFPKQMDRRVRRAMLGVFPSLADVRIDYAWGGTLAISRSRLPVVARLQEGLVAAGGYSGHGVGLALAIGRVVGAAVAGQTDDFDRLTRLRVRAFPGGTALRPTLLALAMRGYSWLDRW